MQEYMLIQDTVQERNATSYCLWSRRLRSYHNHNIMKDWMDQFILKLQKARNKGNQLCGSIDL